MRRGHVVLAAAAIACVVYAIRAADGAVTGIAFARARHIGSGAPSWRSLALLDISDVGFNRFQALREAGEASVSLWNRQADNDGILEADPQLLAIATADFVEALCVAPASSRPWEGLGEVYDRWERIRRAVALGTGDEPEPGVPGSWSDMGLPGRISVGMLRRAIEAGPAWYVPYDELAMLLWRYGLDAESRNAAARSAEVLPLFARHRYTREDDTPPSILEAFAAASWKLEGQVPFLAPRDHLVDLGKLELERGETERASEALRKAMSYPGDALNEAEAQYHLGVALMARERWDEAASSFNLSAEHPAFRAVSLLSLARIAERTGDLEQALRMLRDVRWAEPTNVSHCVEYARVARRLQLWDESLEALHWALVNEPADPWVTTELVQTYLEMGDVTQATSTLRALEASGAEIDVEGLRRAVSAATTRRSPEL